MIGLVIGLGFLHAWYTQIWYTFWGLYMVFGIHKIRSKDKACLNFNIIFGQVNKRFLDVLEYWMLQGGPKNQL